MRLDRAMHKCWWTALFEDMCRVDSQIFKWRLHFLIQIIVLAEWERGGGAKETKKVWASSNLIQGVWATPKYFEPLLRPAHWILHFSSLWGNLLVYELVANPLHPFYVTSQVSMALSLTFSLFFDADLVGRRQLAIQQAFQGFVKLFIHSLVGC